MALTSSQGLSVLTGAKKIAIKRSRSANSASRLDASTLALAHGSNRVYEDGLPDNGANGNTSGVITTVTADGFGTKPAAGSIVSIGGASVKCTESQYDDNVGELRTWSASFTSDYPPED